MILSEYLNDVTETDSWKVKNEQDLRTETF